MPQCELLVECKEKIILIASIFTLFFVETLPVDVRLPILVAFFVLVV